MEIGWKVWQLDGWTVGWIIWLVYFIVLESLAILSTHYPGTLTAHLRPVFTDHPLTWFMALGVWLWVGFHFLIEGVFVDPL